MGGQVHAIDVAPWSSACRLADGWAMVPPFSDEHFFDVVVDYCMRHAIRLVIPTHDRELPVYARLRPLFSEMQIHVACSGPQAVSIAADKRTTREFLVRHQLPSPFAYDPSHCTNLHALPFPLVVKPRFGSGSAGVRVAHDAEELLFYWKRTEQPFVQPLMRGREFTTNFFVNRQQQCVAAVPHWRVETRGGEVSKCVTVREPRLQQIAHQLAELLPDAFGPMCFQAFIDPDDRVWVIEINARFGGGYPIAHHAGANFIQSLIDHVMGRPADMIGDDWQAGVAMTRWDDAVFWNIQELERCG
jgi:carbamoyl-phosphate synthase large subunit